MGIWGPGLYDNDCTADVRESVQCYMEQGIAPHLIKEKIVADYAELFMDSEDGPLVKLALAEQLLLIGALDENDRKATLSYLQDGGDLLHWQSHPDVYELREKELSRLLKLFRTPTSPKRQISVRNKKPVFPWEVGETYALPLCSQKAIELSLDEEYLLFYIFGECHELKDETTPEVWVKITKGGMLPKNSDDFNQLDYVQIACTQMEKRFHPFVREDDLPKEYKQEYHPDAWGYLPEYSMSITETRASRPPKSLLRLERFDDVIPPLHNYRRYRSAHGAVWKHLEEYVLLRYRIHNLRQGKMYK